MATVLVTGGAGFLGAHLCERLLHRGDRVICLDNFHTGRRGNIEALMRHPRFSCLEGDVCQPRTLKVDLVFNLACPASPPRYQADPIRTIKTNILGMLSMLDLAQANNATLLQASTSEVYGDPHVHPQPEQYRGNVSTTGIRACYDEGKRAAETLVYDYHRQHRLRVRVARIFNTYGPGMAPDDGRVVSNFIVQALRGDDLTINGDGSQTRSFCYRDDLVDGLIRLMDAPDTMSMPTNLGNPEEFTIRQLAELVLRLTQSTSRLHFMPLPQDDPLQRCPDIRRARAHLDWEPRTSLESGVLKTIDYFDRLLQSATALAV